MSFAHIRQHGLLAHENQANSEGLVMEGMEGMSEQEMTEKVAENHADAIECITSLPKGEPVVAIFTFSEEGIVIRGGVCNLDVHGDELRQSIALLLTMAQAISSLGTALKKKHDENHAFDNQLPN